MLLWSSSKPILLERVSKAVFLRVTRLAMVAKVFDVTDYKFDYVINLAGETKYSQTDEVYKENIIDVSVTCGKAAAKIGAKRFVEVSTSQVYSGDKVFC